MQKWISGIFEGLEFLHETRSVESNLLSQFVYLHCLRILTNENVYFHLSSYYTKANFLLNR